MTDIAGLIERLEKATGADRELDRAIARHFGWHRVEPRFSRTKRGGWISPEEFMGTYPDGSLALSQHGTTIWPAVPAFTDSLDVALALVERVRPGWQASIIQVARGWEGVLARNFTGRTDRGPHEVCTGIAPAPAIALCLALLRTLETQNG